jgi:hypothetical protein
MLMTFRTINAIIKAYRHEQQENIKISWEQSRLIAFYSANPETVKKAGYKATGLIKFPWEVPDSKPKSLADLKAQFADIDAKIKQIDGQ